MLPPSQRFRNGNGIFVIPVRLKSIFFNSYLPVRLKLIYMFCFRDLLAFLVAYNDEQVQLEWMSTSGGKTLPGVVFRTDPHETNNIFIVEDYSYGKEKRSFDSGKSVIFENQENRGTRYVFNKEEFKKFQRTYGSYLSLYLSACLSIVAIQNSFKRSLKSVSRKR